MSADTHDTPSPDLKLLTPDLMPASVKITARSLRKRARELGQCYVFARQTYVSPEQLVAIIESYRVPAKPTRKINFAREIRGPFTRSLAIDEAKQYEKARKLLDEMKDNHKKKKR